MALDPKQQQEYNRLLQEGIELAKKLGDEISRASFEAMPKSLKAGTDDLKRITSQVAYLKKEFENVNSEIDDISNGFDRIRDNIKNSNTGINETAKGLRGLSSISQQLANHQKGINELSSKEISTLQVKSQIEQARLKRAQDLLSTEKEKLLSELKSKTNSDNNLKLTDKEYREKRDKVYEISKAQKQVNSAVETENNLINQLNKKLQEEYKQVESIEEKIGLTGALIKGISKIPFIGDAINTEKALTLSRNAAKDTGSSFSAMKAGLGSISKDIKIALTDPLAIAGFLGMQLVKTFLSVDKQTGDLAKGFNKSYQEASALRSELNATANATGDINVTTKGLQESLIAVGNTLGSNASLNNKDLVTMTKLRDQVGLANEELVEMQKLTLATGGNLENNTSNLLYAAKTTALNNGVLLNEKQIMQEVSKASASTKLSLGGSSEALGKAAAQAKALGMNLEQVDKIASQMLEIESSISNELEAELLTGKELNLEQARLYALNNDMEGLSKEIAKNFGSAAEFSKMNRLQQEAAAKAVGMSREELAKTLTDQAALKGLSGEQAENAKAALQAARDRGMSEEEIKKQGIDGLMQQQSLQDKFNASIEKLKELFVSLVEPLMPVVDTLSSILSIVGSILKPVEMLFSFFGKIGSAISSLLGPLGMVGKVLKGLAGLAVVFAAYKAFAAAAAIPIAGAILGPLAAAATLAAGFGALNKIKTANDMMSPAGYGKRTLHGPEGAIALNDKDTVIAGTKLFGEEKKINGDKINTTNNKTTNQSTTTTQTTNIDITPIVNELAAVKAVLNQILGKEGAVYLDSTKVGTTLSVGTSKIQ